MTKKINATEAVRTFSEVLNAVKYKGESFTIIRGGKPVAVMVPAEGAIREKRLRDLRSVLDKLPELGSDADVFARDLEEAIHVQPHAPERSSWE
jgi:prevent-host-death family protein